MIFRRVEDLVRGDNVRLDGTLWNVVDVEGAVYEVVVHLSRTIGDRLTLHLRPGDLIGVA